MRSQSIVKSGAAIASAVALLLISVLLAPSPALAQGSAKISGSAKLFATGVEPQASGQAKMTATLYGGWAYNYSGTVMVSCKGLTPGIQYYLNFESDLGGGYAYGVASNGALKLVSGFWSTFPYPGCYVYISSDAGVVLQGYL